MSRSFNDESVTSGGEPCLYLRRSHRCLSLSFALLLSITFTPVAHSFLSIVDTVCTLIRLLRLLARSLARGRRDSISIHPDQTRPEIRERPKTKTMRDDVRLVTQKTTARSLAFSFV